MFEIFLSIVPVVFFYMVLWFGISIILKRNDVVDIAWGLGFVFVAFSVFYNNLSLINFLIFMMVFFWGTRLALHIFLRNTKKDEDYRYKKWREEWGKYFYVRSFFQVYMLQGFLMICISSGFILISSLSNSEPALWQIILGGALWLKGFFFEAVGDAQLTRFIKNPANAGKIMTGGLWKYTRHPNYFGEIAMWWGIWIFTIGTPIMWVALISPITITFLLLKISGIPLLEKKYDGNVEFQEYKKRTSALFPLPPKV